MYLAQVSYFVPESVDAETVEFLFTNLLATWYKNGQTCGHRMELTFVDSRCLAPVMLPEGNALAPEHDNAYVRKDAEAMLAAGMRGPEVTILGEDLEEPAVCACPLPTSYILFTHMFTQAPPLQCGTCFRPVPLYRIPPTSDGEYLGILGWRDDYQACDTLWLNSGTLERAATREMSRVDSSLSQNGRSICDAITVSTGVPTYYYLFHFHGRSAKQERERQCPGCGGAWRLDKPISIIDFRCDRCRLMSSIATDLS